MNSQAIDTMNQDRPASGATEVCEPRERKIINRWALSFHVAMPDGKCGWRRHCHFSVRQVLGYLEYIAARDPERFVWAQWEAISKNAAEIKEKPPSRRQIYAITAMLRAEGVLEPIVKYRRGARRKGFVVREHDEWTKYFSHSGLCAISSSLEMAMAQDLRAKIRKERSAAYRLRTVSVPQ